MKLSVQLNEVAYGDGVYVAPTFMVGNGIGNARPAGDEPPRYKITLKFNVLRLATFRKIPDESPVFTGLSFRNLTCLAIL